MLTYRYPAAFIPFAAIASAASRMICSLMLHANLFQLFQPMGGVSASWSGGLAAATASNSPTRAGVMGIGYREAAPAVHFRIRQGRVETR